MTPTGSTAPALDNEGAGFERLEVTFTGGLPGFEYLRRFVIEPIPGELAPFCRLRAIDPPGAEFIVVPPGLLFPDYTVELDEETVDRLELRAEEAVVLTVITLSEQGGAPTANLLGPIVINRRTGAAAQVVLHGSGYEVAVPLVPPVDAP